MVLLGAISLSTFVLQNVEARKTVQNVILSIVDIDLLNSKETEHDNDKVQFELDEAAESFFNKIIQNFITSWYANISRDESFVWNLKQEIAEAVRQITVRVKKVRIN